MSPLSTRPSTSLSTRPSAAFKQPDTPESQAAAISQQQQIPIEEILESIANYNKLGEALQRATTMQEVGGQLAQIAEYAEQAVVNEADNWFDKHTVGRNMKEIKTYAKDFTKLAEEADTLNQRMTALYDDMGRILERYFEIPDVLDPMAQATGKPAAAGVPSEKEVPDVGQDGPEELTEAPGEPGLAVAPDPKVYAATPEPPVKPENKKVDELTLRAIKAVYNRLKKTNPDMASRFAHLPPRKMQQIVWKLVR